MAEAPADAALVLVVVRHAKAAWPDDVADHDRPLTGRGRRDAAALGAALADRGLRPDLVLCSTATRTQQTWSLAAQALAGAPGPPPVRLVAEVYDAPAARLLALLRTAEDAGQADGPSPGCLALIGHNPGMEELVLRLAGVSEHLKTATTAVLELPAPWSQADTAVLQEIFTSRGR